MPRNSTCWIEKICPECGSPFQAYIAKLKFGKGQFCSVPCAAKARGRNGLIAQNHSLVRARVTLTCEHCGQDFERFADWIRNGQTKVFCSLDCFYANQTERSRKVPAIRPERFAVNEENGCWEWLDCLSDKGYGHVRFRGKPTGAHRASYIQFRGEIPDGLEIDHLCRNPKCINPDHLEPVTRSENVRRGWPYREKH